MHASGYPNGKGIRKPPAFLEKIVRRFAIVRCPNIKEIQRKPTDIHEQLKVKTTARLSKQLVLKSQKPSNSEKTQKGDFSLDRSPKEMARDIEKIRCREIVETITILKLDYKQSFKKLDFCCFDKEQVRLRTGKSLHLLLNFQREAAKHSCPINLILVGLISMLHSVLLRAKPKETNCRNTLNNSVPMFGRNSSKKNLFFCVRVEKEPQNADNGGIVVLFFTDFKEPGHWPFGRFTEVITNSHSDEVRQYKQSKC